MKKHKLIVFTLWSAANILLILRLREYLIIAPVLAVQVVIWICCSVLFLMDVSSRGIRIGINIVAILVGLLAIFCILPQSRHSLFCGGRRLPQGRHIATHVE